MTKKFCSLSWGFGYWFINKQFSDSEILRWLERGNSASEDAGPRKGWIMRSYIGWRGDETFFVKVWKSLPSRCVLKILRGSPKGKVQRGQYLLAVGEGNQCRQGRWTPKRSGLWDPTSVGEKNEAFFIRVWRPLLNRHVFKTLRGCLKGKVQRGQYLLAVGEGNEC